MAQYYIGTSGWVYPHWRGVFYPPQLPQSHWLGHYTQNFATVELNNTFYRLPSEQAFIRWRESTPPGFLFALKVSRFITHIKRLRNAQEPLNNFLGRARLLGDKLGPLLYQLPPQMHCRDEVLEEFLKLLPPDLEHVFEFRHQSWLEEGVLELLHRYNAGFCVFDMPGLTAPVVATSEVAYIRFHGSTGLYWSCYSDEELKDWATRIKTLPTKTVYIYFNNDAESYAVRNARALAQILTS